MLILKTSCAKVLVGSNPTVGVVICAVESWWKMIKEALIACSSNGIITLSLDGKTVKGVVCIDNISNIYRKDTEK